MIKYFCDYCSKECSDVYYDLEFERVDNSDDWSNCNRIDCRILCPSCAKQLLVQKGGEE